jgi:GPH family glycoside/pentoside/hexuronide:cation symporter
VFLPKAWDVVLNPIAGRISDRHQSPLGPRRPFLLRAGLALAACFALLFAGPPLGSTVADAAWVVVAFLGCATAYAFFQVPFVAMPAEITDSYDERTRLMTWRVALLALAILVSGASAPAIRDALGGRDGYRVMGLFVALLIVAGVLGAYHGTRRAPVGRVRAAGGSLREQLRIVGHVADFRLLLTTFVVQALAVGAMLAGVDYVSRYVIGREGAATVLFVCFVGPALLLTPVWTALGTRVGKKRGYVAASAFLLVGALLLVGARELPAAGVFVATGLVGVGYAGAQVFPLAMLADTAAVDAARTGENRAGVFTGVWTAGETLGLALGPGVFALVLAAGGYVSSTGADVTQPESAVTAITLGFSVLPAALVAISLWWLVRYSLTQADVDAAVREEATS